MTLTPKRPEHGVRRPASTTAPTGATTPPSPPPPARWTSTDATTPAGPRTTALGERVHTSPTRTARPTGRPPHGPAAPRGRGPARGLPLDRPGAARQVCDTAYRAGLLLTTAGRRDEAVNCCHHSPRPTSNGWAPVLPLEADPQLVVPGRGRLHGPGTASSVATRLRTAFTASAGLQPYEAAAPDVLLVTAKATLCTDGSSE